MQCVCIQHGVAKWLAGRLKTKKLDWGTLAHIPHPQMTLSHDIVETHCCIRVNGSQLKSTYEVVPLTIQLQCSLKWNAVAIRFVSSTPYVVYNGSN